MLAALTLGMSLTASVVAETTHEANQAAAEIAATAIPAVPSMLTAKEALILVTDVDGTMRFDIAEDGTRTTWIDQAAGNLTAHDATCFSQGYIYPAGTLSAQIDGVNADGSPQFPDQVLGLWSSYGWSVGDGTQDSDRPRLLSTQLYQFGREWGAATLVSEGYGLANTGSTVARAITGGTGPFAVARGELIDTNLGVNETEGGNARYEVHLMAGVSLMP
jgi:hypothetical protein